MKSLRNLSIKAKLNLLGTLTAAMALLLACVVFVMNDVSGTKAAMVQHLSTLADVLGGNSTAALTFNDPKAVADVLESLHVEPTIRVAAVFDRQGQRFAAHERQAGSFPLPLAEAIAQTGHSFEPDPGQPPLGGIVSHPG